MSDLEQLVSFGFEEKKAKRALRKTKNSGLQSALDWLGDHEDSTGENSEEEGNAAAASNPEAKSLKCLDCGKVFRSTEEASYHGDRSGHANFEESTEEKKALTEDEKKAKLEELREKAVARKSAKAKTDAEDAKKNDALRRKAGKDLGSIKEDLKLKEALKEADARKKEKIDDAKARARIKAQIEADKKERAEKTAREKALRDGTPLPVMTGDVAGPRPPASNAPAAGSSSKKETRLQIRLPAGTPLTTTRKSEDTLNDVLAWVHENNSMKLTIEGKISIPFPRKSFSPEEMGKNLQELGLVPSSVLIIN